MCIGEAEANQYIVKDGRVTNRVCMHCGEHCWAIGDIHWTLNNGMVYCSGCRAAYQLQHTIGCDHYQIEFVHFNEYNNGFTCGEKHEVEFNWC